MTFISIYQRSNTPGRIHEKPLHWVEVWHQNRELEKACRYNDAKPEASNVINCYTKLVILNTSKLLIVIYKFQTNDISYAHARKM